MSFNWMVFFYTWLGLYPVPQWKPMKLEKNTWHLNVEWRFYQVLQSNQCLIGIQLEITSICLNSQRTLLNVMNEYSSLNLMNLGWLTFKSKVLINFIQHSLFIVFLILNNRLNDFVHSQLQWHEIREHLFFFVHILKLHHWINYRWHFSLIVQFFFVLIAAKPPFISWRSNRHMTLTGTVTKS